MILTLATIFGLSVANAQHSHIHLSDETHVCPECGGIYLVYHPHIAKYAGNVGVGLGSVIDSEFGNRDFAYSITTEHGIDITKANWKSSVFVGLGTGLQFYKSDEDIWNIVRINCQLCDDNNHYGDIIRKTTTTSLYVPVYVTARVNFNKKGRVSPFIKFNQGAFIGIHSWEKFTGTFKCERGFKQSESHTEGDDYIQGDVYMLSGFETGVSVKLKNRYAISAGVSANVYTSFTNGAAFAGCQVQGAIRFEF